MSEGVERAVARLCPHCVKRNPDKWGYKASATHAGWHCHGYRSRRWDRRITGFEEAATWTA